MTVGFDRDAWRAERLRALDREVIYLRAERQRLEGLLGRACVELAALTGEPWHDVLDRLCRAADTNPARPAFREEEERESTAAMIAGALDALRATGPVEGGRAA